MMSPLKNGGIGMDYQKEDHLDLRQRKTRKLLVEALAQLLVERPYQELSVVDICNRAMVHRTTFYAHFNDKQELLRYLLEGLERECVATCLPRDPERGPREYLPHRRPECISVFCPAQGSVPGLSEQRGGRSGPYSGGLRRRGALPPAVRAPVPDSLPSGGSPGGRSFLYRRHARPDPLVALQRPAPSRQPSSDQSGTVYSHFSEG